MISTTYIWNILRNFAYWLRYSQTTMNFMVFYGFTMTIDWSAILIIIFVISASKYVEFDGNRKAHLFGTAPLMGFGSFVVV